MLAQLDQDQVAQSVKEILAEMLNVVPVMINVLYDLNTAFPISVGNGLDGVVKDLLVDQPEDFGDILIPYLLPSIRDDLIEKALSIPHAAFRFSRNHQEAPLTDFNPLSFDNLFQVLDHLF